MCIVIGDPYDGKASDMWAMGVILFTMVCGQFPFFDNDRQELFKKIRSADFVIPRYAGLSFLVIITMRQFFPTAHHKEAIMKSSI